MHSLTSRTAVFTSKSEYVINDSPYLAEFFRFNLPIIRFTPTGLDSINLVVHRQQMINILFDTTKISKFHNFDLRFMFAQSILYTTYTKLCCFNKFL